MALCCGGREVNVGLSLLWRGVRGESVVGWVQCGPGDDGRDVLQRAERHL